MSIRTPPVQSPTETIWQYLHTYVDYMDMRGYLQSDATNLNNSNELDLFIEGCTHSAQLFTISRDDRLSSDPIMKLRFTQGAIVNTLTSYLRALALPDGASQTIHHSSRSPPDSDSDSEDDRKHRKIKKSRRTNTLRRSGAARLNKVTIDLQHPLASLQIPADVPACQVLQLRMYQAGIRAVISRPERFTDGMKCAICQKQHKFGDCPILQNIEFLKKHFIAFCLMMNRTTKLMEREVKKITATINKLATDVADDDDAASDSSDSDTTDDTQHFQQGED